MGSSPTLATRIDNVRIQQLSITEGSMKHICVGKGISKIKSGTISLKICISFSDGIHTLGLQENANSSIFKESTSEVNWSLQCQCAEFWTGVLYLHKQRNGHWATVPQFSIWISLFKIWSPLLAPFFFFVFSCGNCNEKKKWRKRGTNCNHKTHQANTEEVFMSFCCF